MAARFSPPNPVFMRRAIAEALDHLPELAVGPFGACLVQGDEVLAVAHNTVLQDRDPTCHAEMNAIRLATAKLKTYDLSGCEIYTTTAPCPMGLAAIHWARLRRVIYGTTIFEVAHLGFNEIHRHPADANPGRQPGGHLFRRPHRRVATHPGKLGENSWK